MNVGTSVYEGTLKTVYRITPSGSLNWNLEFTPNVAGQFRLVYSWSNLTSSYSLASPLKQFRTSYGLYNYSFSWGDIANSFNTTAIVFGGKLTLTVSLGQLGAGTSLRIDPSLVVSPVLQGTTGYTFQRKVF